MGSSFYTDSELSQEPEALCGASPCSLHLSALAKGSFNWGCVECEPSCFVLGAGLVEESAKREEEAAQEEHMWPAREEGGWEVKEGLSGLGVQVWDNLGGTFGLGGDLSSAVSTLFGGADSPLTGGEDDLCRSHLEDIMGDWGFVECEPSCFVIGAVQEEELIQQGEDEAAQEEEYASPAGEDGGREEEEGVSDRWGEVWGSLSSVSMLSKGENYPLSEGVDAPLSGRGDLVGLLRSQEEEE